MPLVGPISIILGIGGVENSLHKVFVIRRGAIIVHRLFILIALCDCHKVETKWKGMAAILFAP